MNQEVMNQIIDRLERLENGCRQPVASPIEIRKRRKRYEAALDANALPIILLQRDLLKQAKDVLEQWAILGSGKCTIGKPLADMTRDFLSALQPDTGTKETLTALGEV